ncbi:uncharacterized protein LOC126803864 [Argentina anserina]|uniref:uncharacterized protein LOC126803864 n=1 Tax=Argentina anserina TaxID=57926 RepID=UPI0021762B03|nr:uncharacterized protein LOC126803864 [Potentilla anserina]
MANKRGAAGQQQPPSGSTQHSEELASVESELQTLKTNTTAQISGLQASLTDQQAALSSFRDEILAELRAMRTATPDLSLVKFGTLPPVIETPGLVSLLESTSDQVLPSSTTTTSTSSQPISKFDQLYQFATTQPIVTNSAGAVLNTITVSKVSPKPSTEKRNFEKGETSRGKGTGSGSEKPYTTQFFQHTPNPQVSQQFSPHYNFAYTNIPPGSFGNTSFVPANFVYPHSGPGHFTHQPGPSNTPCSSNTQLQSHRFSPQYTAATITSHIPPHAYTGPYPYSGYQPNCQQQFMSNNWDPNLPTMKQMKLEMPTFGGNDPIEWVSKVEQYFEFYQVPEDRKLAIATMHLVDRASDRWFMFKHEFPQTWSGLCDLLLREFSEHNLGDYQAALARMSQTGSVEQFMEQFTKLSRRAPGFTPENLLFFFIGGLKSSIRSDVRAQNPKTLYVACALAKIFEEKELIQRQAGRNTFVPRPTPAVAPTIPRVAPAPVQLAQLRPAPIVRAPQAGNQGGNRRMTRAEYLERRARGLCLFCDEQYRPGHNCRHGNTLMAIEIIPDEMELQGPEVNEGDVEIHHVDNPDKECDLQLHSVEDGDNVRTMQLKGEFQGKEAHVLIDSGASRNFIHPSVLRKSGVTMQEIKPLRVRVASGQIMVTSTMVEVPITLQHYSFVTSYYVLPISGCKIVLGAAWLRTLGDIVWNFERMTMKFWDQGREQSLQGNTEVDSSVVSCKAMTRTLRKEKEALLVQLNSIVSLPKPDTHTPTNSHIQNLIHKYSDVFETPTQLPPPRPRDHKIKLLPNTCPINVRPYRYPQFQKNEIEKIIQELLTNGVIRPSVSPYSSPVILVKKKDGSWRLCIDYRALNAATVKDKYPIPVVDELIDEVHGATLFTKLDLRAGYHQIRMHERDIEKTVFRTHSGHYEFLVMPFGLTNAPSTFQAVLNDALRELLRKGVLVFFDDILIYSSNLEQHLQQLEHVFKILRHHSLKVKESKCSFGVSQVEYLGHVVSGEGVSVDPAKIQAISQWPRPLTLKQLRGFLGLAGYYRKYVRNFGIIAKPLTDLLKKDAFCWNPKAEFAFEELKHALTHTPVLAYPDFSQEFVVECDASDAGIGAILSQNGHPIAFMSKALAQRHLALSVTLEHFLKQKITTPAQQKWLIKLLGYDYSISYKAGQNNVVLDALSRVPALVSLMGISSPVQGYIHDLQQSCLIDSEAAAIITQLQQGNEKKYYQWTDSHLFYKDRIFVPRIDGWRHKIISEFNDGKRHHYEAMKPPGLLQPIAIPEQAWQVISMDFIDALPKSEGKTTIWVIIDKFTKYAHFIPISHPYTAASLAKLFVHEVARLHGMPTQIISDRDPVFMSLFWEEFFKLQGTKLSKSSAYHPQSDDQTENLNRTLEQYLRCVVDTKPKEWVAALPWAEWWYNTSHHLAIDMSPFKALYGYEATSVRTYLPGSTAVAQVDKELIARDELLKVLKMNLEVAQSRMKKYYDLRHTELKLPDTARIHNVFHVSLLKKKLGTHVVVETELPPLFNTSTDTWEPEEVLQIKIVKRNNVADAQWLIKWRGKPVEEATWEFYDDLKERFPEFLLQRAATLQT